MNNVKQFILYLIRWQLSSPLLAALCLLLLPFDTIINTMIANLVGGIIFYFVDKTIFKLGGNKK